MRMRNGLAISLCLIGLGAMPPYGLAQEPQAMQAQQQDQTSGDPVGRYGLGTRPTRNEIAGWNIDASPPGRGLPKASGSVEQGRDIYAAKCVACHGPDGSGPMDRLVGGRGTLDSEKPVRTVGSYWPYATTLWDYIRRAMPFDNPNTLSPEEVYAVTAYVLHMNGLLPANATLDQAVLPQVQMPNRGAFYVERRPDVRNQACMKNCRPLETKVRPETVGQPAPSEVQ